MYHIIISIILLLLLAACSSNEPSEPVKIIDAAQYFPIADGDAWFYKTSGSAQIKRIISGDTTIGDAVCKRVAEEGITTEAWAVDSAGFYIYLLSTRYRFDPPLQIPFSLEQGKPYIYQTTAYWTESGTPYYAEVSGSVEFVGYVEKEVPAGRFSKVVKLHYESEGEEPYDEYYAKNVGLLDNGEYILDSAYIGGVWHRGR
jgi:hypothetical protein